MALEQPPNFGADLWVLEVAGRQVYRDGELKPRVEPHASLPDRLLEHERRQRADRPVLLGELDELACRDQPAPRVVPAHKRLDADDGLGDSAHLRLVVERELPQLDRVPQLADQRKPVGAVVVVIGE